MAFKITSFRGKHGFLSNFHEAPITDKNGDTWPSVEHAYQAMKTKNQGTRDMIRTRCPTPSDARFVGKALNIRPDWEKIKLPLMRKLVKLKFEQNPELMAKLKATGDRVLIEGNFWNDTYWGMCRGYGQNHLGQILMEVRNGAK